MRPLSPLVTEALRGLDRGGPARQPLLAYLVVQAFALVVWWPDQDILWSLQRQKGPDTALAVVIVLGAATAYHALRTGAEELLAPDQQSLREWAVATPLGIARIVAGYITGHLLEAAHLVALSLPLLVLAFAVAGIEWAALGWCLAAILTQSIFYRLAGAVIQMAIGHLDAVAFVCVRALMVSAYAGALALYPAASHVAVSYRLLGGGAPAEALAHAAAGHGIFIAIHVGLGVALAIALHAQLAAARRSAN